LVKRASAGDEAAFEELYRLKLRTILYHINTLVNSPHDAEDIAQEVGITLLKSIGSLKSPEAFHVWMQRIITNKCYRYLSKHRHIREQVDIDDYADELEETDKEFLPREFAESEDLKNTIADIIESLPEQRRRMIVMYYYDDMSYKEIAETLDITTSTVSTSIMKAKKMIKNELEKNMTGMSDIDDRSDYLPGNLAAAVPMTVPAMTVAGEAIRARAAQTFPDATIDRAGDAMHSFINSGGAQAGRAQGAKNASDAARAFSGTWKAIAAAIAGTVVLTVGIFAYLDVTSPDTAYDTAATTTTGQAAVTLDLRIDFTGGGCECGHLNPKSAMVTNASTGSRQQPEDLQGLIWQITKVAGEGAGAGAVIASGEGTDPSAALTTLYKEKADGEYRLEYSFRNNGTTYRLNREFAIDTGEIRPGEYK
jgi:RNA polymerase sigma-70 factor (ECF subfamily)